MRPTWRTSFATACGLATASRHPVGIAGKFFPVWCAKPSEPCANNRKRTWTRHRMSMRLKINGEERVSNSDPLSPLVDVLREEFHLTGAKPVCREGFCGACMVLVDDRPTPSCLMPAALAQDAQIHTVEALATNGVFNPIQEALEACDAVQCGMCFPGMVVTLTHLLETRPGATREDIRAALTGNICRCTGYERIVDAA